MAYCTQTDCQNRSPSLPWWTDDAYSGSANATVVSACIADAEAKVNQYASQQYAVPLSLGTAATAGMVREATVAVALYYLASRLMPDNVPENLRAMFEDALKWLQMLAEGKVALPGETPTSTSRPGAAIVYAAEEQVVSRENFKAM